MPAVGDLAPGEFGHLEPGDHVDLVRADLELAYDVVVQHPDGSTGHRAHGEFLVPRYAELAYAEHVERGAKSFRHRSGRDYTSAGEPEHGDVGAVGVDSQMVGQVPPALGAIGISDGSQLALPGHGATSSQRRRAVGFGGSWLKPSLRGWHESLKGAGPLEGISCRRPSGAAGPRCASRDLIGNELMALRTARHYRTVPSLAPYLASCRRHEAVRPGGALCPTDRGPATLIRHCGFEVAGGDGVGVRRTYPRPTISSPVTFSQGRRRLVRSMAPAC